MRILQVNQINQVAYIYGDDLLQRGHTLNIYAPSMVGGLAPFPLKLACMPWRILDMTRVVGKLDRRHFDLVHIHWASYGVLGLTSRIPFIVHCHGSDVRSRLQQPLFRRLLTTIFRRATAVMCITPDLLPLARSVRPDVLFFPAPVDTKYFAPETNRSQHLTRPWTILLFTRLDHNKGIDITLEGIAHFAHRYPAVHVQLLDWGPLKEECRRRYGECFEFIPPVSPHEVKRLILSADVIVGQCALGVLGLSELQAMSCAKPVIASFRYETAYDSLPPMLQATTAEEVELYLEKLFLHPAEGVRLGQQAREWVVKTHDSNVLTGKLELLYQSILAHSN